MTRILRDPLIYFLFVGLGLFVLFDLVGSDEAAYDSRVINVDRDALLTFVQYRSRAFQPQAAAARLDAMPEDELDRLIGDYVREEALHREAKALGMDQNDYIIKRRMIQSIEFITDGFVTAAVDVSDQDVSAYYEANRDDYYISPFATFTHVFFDGERHSRDEAFGLAKAPTSSTMSSVIRSSSPAISACRWPSRSSRSIPAIRPGTARSSRNTACTSY
jgi:hypothetical protein